MRGDSSYYSGDAASLVEAAEPEPEPEQSADEEAEEAERAQRRADIRRLETGSDAEEDTTPPRP